jgi:hypothetical protein
MAGVPGQRQDPAVVLLGDKRHGGGPFGDGADHDQLFLPQCSGARPQVPAGVFDVHPDLLLGRRVVAEFFEPRRGPPGAAGRVGHEIGGQDLFLSGAAGARPHPGTGDPVAGRCGDQASHVAPVPYCDVGQGPDPLADLAFQVWPARLIRRLAGFAVLAQQVALSKIRISRG